jgi:hypothetical protein
MEGKPLAYCVGYHNKPFGQSKYEQKFKQMPHIFIAINNISMHVRLK